MTRRERGDGVNQGMSNEETNGGIMSEPMTQFHISYLVWSLFEQKEETGIDFAIFRFEKTDYWLY